LHDVLVVVGIFSIFGKVFGTEINTMFITGLLTVIGFSTHDTIVVFDRIRENVGRNPGVGLQIGDSSLTGRWPAQHLGDRVSDLIACSSWVARPSSAPWWCCSSVSWDLRLDLVAQILVSWEEGDLGRILGRFFPHLAPAPGQSPASRLPL
jgi:hypothetical protein